MENYLRFEFPQSIGPEQEELLAELAEWPFDGFEEQNNCLVAYIPESDCDKNLRDYLSELFHQKNWSNVKEEIIAPQNWNAEWEKQYEPVLVNSFCAIRATFHEPVPNVEYEIVITPKMSFGTGHHATTFMMVREMKKYNFTNKAVLDYGCGTSVLAILAAKLGADQIDAIDIDHWAYENSLENIAINDVQGKIKVFEGDWTILPENSSYDIILANINRHIILGSMPDMAARINNGGYLLCSGFLEGDVDMITEAANESGMKLVFIAETEQWRCLTFVKE
jgi:ribosomal protein L11 methyltransferase